MDGTEAMKMADGGNRRSIERNQFLHKDLGRSQGNLVSPLFYGEFDPGSELTLAECITHASQAGLPEITSTGSLAADE